VAVSSALVFERVLERLDRLEAILATCWECAGPPGGAVSAASTNTAPYIHSVWGLSLHRRLPSTSRRLQERTPSPVPSIRCWPPTDSLPVRDRNCALTRRCSSYAGYCHQEKLSNSATCWAFYWQYPSCDVVFDFAWIPFPLSLSPLHLYRPMSVASHPFQQT